MSVQFFPCICPPSRRDSPSWDAHSDLPTTDGLLYNAINRGNDRRVIFADDDDHRAFLQSLARTQLRYPFRLYGYCLMSNHFHLLLRPEPGISISRILQSLTVAHTWRFHRRHRSSGHVWQGRFKSPVVQDDGHFWAVLRYIETNPLRAKMVSDPAAHRWSSYPAHGEGLADPLLTPLPEWVDLGQDEPSRRASWRRRVMADQPETEVDSIRRSLRGGSSTRRPGLGRIHGRPARAIARTSVTGTPKKRSKHELTLRQAKLGRGG